MASTFSIQRAKCRCGVPSINSMFSQWCLDVSSISPPKIWISSLINHGFNGSHDPSRPLLNVGLSHRATRGLASSTRGQPFQSIDFRATRGIGRSQVISLTNANWVRDHETSSRSWTTEVAECLYGIRSFSRGHPSGTFSSAPSLSPYARRGHHCPW